MFDFSGKVVVVTGGARGISISMERERLSSQLMLSRFTVENEHEQIQSVS